MRIGLDLDGVVFKFTKPFSTHVAKCKPHLAGTIGNLDAEARVWDWFTDWPMTREEFLKEMTCAVDAGELFWNGELFENDIAWQVQRMQDAGHEIHIVTHRFSGTAAKASEIATVHALNQVGIRYHSLTFAKDKTSVKTDLFLEDNVENYDALDAAGVGVFLINRPYNYDWDGRRRVDSFTEFVDLVLSIV